MSIRPCAIIVHGGAGQIPEESLPSRLEGCKQAALAGWKILESGGSAVGAGEAAGIFLEGKPPFKPRTSSHLKPPRPGGDGAPHHGGRPPPPGGRAPVT